MSQNLRNYTKVLYTLDAIVNRTPADAWDKKSPCAEWTAREVLGHFMWGVQRVAAVASDTALPAELAEAKVAGPNPAASWAETRDLVLASLDQPGALQRPFTGPFGPGTLDSFIAVHTMDGLMHSWDIAKTAGIDAHLPADLVEAAMGALAGAGDAIRGPGLFGPAVEVSADADAATRLAAFSGRSPH